MPKQRKTKEGFLIGDALLLTKGHTGFRFVYEYYEHAPEEMRMLVENEGGDWEHVDFDEVIATLACRALVQALLKDSSMQSQVFLDFIFSRNLPDLKVEIKPAHVDRGEVNKN